MNFQTMTTDERERFAYAEGFTETAAILGALDDVEQERDTLTAELEDIPSETQRDQDARDLEDLKQFFYDCFQRLAGHYPSPSWSSDYDKNVIFEIIDKAEGMNK